MSKYLDVFVDIEDLVDDFGYFPLEYLDLEIKEDKENNNTYIKISFKLDLYKDIFNEVIRGKIVIDNLKSLWNSGEKDGVKFEELIVEQLWNNVLKLKEIFPEKNKIKIKEIYNIKDYNG